MHYIKDPELNLDGKIYVAAPIQAERNVNGSLFYFRARWNEWTFSVSEHPDIDPVDIQTPEAGKQYGYFTEGKYGTESEYKASYMENDVAENIILQCASAYLQRKKTEIE